MEAGRYNHVIYLASDGRKDFRFWIFISVVIHLLLATAISVSKSSERKMFYIPVYEVALLPIPEAKQPRVVQKMEEVAPPLKPAEEKAKPKKKKARGLAKTFSRAKKAELSRAEDAISKLREKYAEEDAIENIRKKVKERESAKTDSVRIATTPPSRVYQYDELDAELRAYFDRISRLIRDAWSLPETVKDKGMTVLSVHIRRDGTIESLWLEKSSGNRFYDDSTIRAINKVNPLPPIPKGWKEGAIDLGLRF